MIKKRLNREVLRDRYRGHHLHIVPDPVCNIRELETVGLLAVDVKHGDGSEGGAKGGEAEDEH